MHVVKMPILQTGRPPTAPARRKPNYFAPTSTLPGFDVLCALDTETMAGRAKSQPTSRRAIGTTGAAPFSTPEISSKKLKSLAPHLPHPLLRPRLLPPLLLPLPFCRRRRRRLTRGQPYSSRGQSWCAHQLLPTSPQPPVTFCSGPIKRLPTVGSIPIGGGLGSSGSCVALWHGARGGLECIRGLFVYKSITNLICIALSTDRLGGHVDVANA